MTLAVSNRAQLRYIVESAFGAIPVAGNPNELRFTGESLTYSIKTDTSKEIRSDRQISDTIQVGASSSGGINFELSYREYDTLLQATMLGTWAEFGTSGVSAAVFSGTINSSAGTITAAVAPTSTDAFTGLGAGQWFRLTAPGDAADGAWLRAHASTAITTTVITVDALTPIPGSGTRSGVANCKLAASRLTNGTTERTFTIERALNDINQFFAFRGQKFNKLSLGFQSGSIVNGSFDLMGKDVLRAASTQLPGSPVTSQTYDVLNAVTGSGTILEGNAALSGTFLKSVKFDLDNKVRTKDAVGYLGAVDASSGTCMVSGTMEVYLADGVLYDKFLNNTRSSLVWSCKDSALNGYVFTLPALKYGDAKVTAGSLDQDCMLSLPFQGIRDTVSGKTIILDRLGA